MVSLSRLFADDTSLAYSSNHFEDIEYVLNADMQKLHEWAQKWLVKFNQDKTEALVISNSKNNLDINLLFNSCAINIVDAHKHLGITLSDTGKWSEHISNISSEALKQINALRKLKYVLDRKTLNRIYMTFILPILEYGCELWDGCSNQNSEKLEKVQLEAARVVTGLPSFASKDALYFETGWEKLKIRRERRKLCLLYKIINGLAPDYLLDLLPPIVNTVVPYNVRNGTDFTLYNFTLSLTNKSFFPSTIRLWNNLSESQRAAETVNQFKSAIRSERSPKIPEFFHVGKRLNNILMTKLRHRCSSLNDDLFRVNLIAYPACVCGYPIENSQHYFLNCPRYEPIREQMLNNIGNRDTINVKVLLNGDSRLSNEENQNIILSHEKKTWANRSRHRQSCRETQRKNYLMNYVYVLCKYERYC